MYEGQSDVSLVIDFVTLNLSQFVAGQTIKPRTGRKSTARGCNPGKNNGHKNEEPRGNNQCRINEPTERLFDELSTTRNPLINICEPPSDIIPNPSFMHRPMALIYCHIISPGYARLHRASPGLQIYVPSGASLNNIFV
ncbi:hypothetical protein DYD21_05315 [Rhodohalobacter sp. SW132]|nr:hypothetical protein DYD21_05315 [Rhodohalobacter sp. SW132]